MLPFTYTWIFKSIRLTDFGVGDIFQEKRDIKYKTTKKVQAGKATPPGKTIELAEVHFIGSWSAYNVQKFRDYID